MRLWLVFCLFVGVGVTVSVAWEELLFPMAMMNNMQQQQRRQQMMMYNAYRPPPGIYGQPVGSAAGWNTGYQRAPVRDAQWYDNNT